MNTNPITASPVSMPSSGTASSSDQGVVAPGQRSAREIKSNVTHRKALARAVAAVGALGYQVAWQRVEDAYAQGVLWSGQSLSTPQARLEAVAAVLELTSPARTPDVSAPGLPVVHAPVVGGLGVGWVSRRVAWVSFLREAAGLMRVGVTASQAWLCAARSPEAVRVLPGVAGLWEQVAGMDPARIDVEAVASWGFVDVLTESGVTQLVAARMYGNVAESLAQLADRAEAELRVWQLARN